MHILGCFIIALTLLAAPATAEMTLTAAGQAAGFRLSTFADGFPNASSVGPLGVVFPASGGVLVSDYPGNVRRFPNNSDGQHATNVPPLQSFGGQNAAGLTLSGSGIYLVQRGLQRLVELDTNGAVRQVIATGLTGATAATTNPANGHVFVGSISNLGIWDIDPVAKTKTSFKAAGTYEIGRASCRERV